MKQKHCDLIIAWANGAEIQFKEWLVLHNECPNKMFSSHIAFKYLLRKTQYK